MIDPAPPGEPGLTWIGERSGPDHHRRHLGWYAWRALILAVIPVGLITIAVAGSLSTYRAVQAAEGHGTKGYFVDVHGVVGEFRLPDGQVTRPRVSFADPPPRLRAGVAIPALDTGDVTYVFARHGSRHWETNAGVLAFVLLAFGAWLWFVPLRKRHKRRVKATGVPSGPRRTQRAIGTTVTSAAAEPVWAKSSIGLLNGDISTRRVNTALQAAGDHKAFPLLVTVGVPLTDTDRATYPVPGEADRVRAITDRVTALIAGHGVLAASIADRNGWAFLIYTGTTDWLDDFESQMRSELADHIVVFRGRRDPGWRAYRDLWRMAPRTLQARERIVLITIIPLLCAAPGGRYGLAWAIASFVSIEAWAAVVAFAPRSRLIPAQLAHPGISVLALAGLLWTLLFPVGAIVVHPANPWLCAAGAAVVAIAFMGALWPAQRRYVARMRESGALQPPDTAAV